MFHAVLLSAKTNPFCPCHGSAMVTITQGKYFFFGGGHRLCSSGRADHSRPEGFNRVISKYGANLYSTSEKTERLYLILTVTDKDRLPRVLLLGLYITGKYEALMQYRFTVGPASQTLDQQWASITSRLSGGLIKVAQSTAYLYDRVGYEIKY